MALKLLLVENDWGLQRTLKEWVQALGVEVLALSEAREAARRIQNDRFDGFLIEAHVGPPDGLDLVTSIRTHTSSRSAPIALLLAEDDREVMRRAFARGISVFLYKPVTQERLTALIRAMRGPMLAEKQRRARMPVRFAVLCSHEGAQVDAVAVNLGEGGVLLELPVPPSRGAEIGMQFAVPGTTQPVSARGRVLRVEPPNRVAVEFWSVAPEGLDAIRAFIRGAIKE